MPDSANSARRFVQAFLGFCSEWMIALWQKVRSDFTAKWLIAANAISVAWVLLTDDSWSSVLLLYWLELFIIGFYAMIKFPFIHRVAGWFIMPLFAIVYFAMLQWLLIPMVAVLEAEKAGPLLRGSLGQDRHALMVVAAAIPLFISHGISFLVNFVGGRQWESMSLEQNMMRGLLRITPFFLMTIPVTLLVVLTGQAFVAALFMVPVKILCDLAMHFKVNNI